MKKCKFSALIIDAATEEQLVAVLNQLFGDKPEVNVSVLPGPTRASYTVIAREVNPDPDERTHLTEFLDTDSALVSLIKFLREKFPEPPASTPARVDDSREVLES